MKLAPIMYAGISLNIFSDTIPGFPSMMLPLILPLISLVVILGNLSKISAFLTTKSSKAHSRVVFKKNLVATSPVTLCVEI